MTNKNSLKYQFKKQLAISIGLLVIVFSFLLYQIFFIGIGTTMHRTMMSMAGHYAKQIELNPNISLPSGGAYSAFVGREAIPNKIEHLFDFDAIKDFSFSVNDGDRFVKSSRPKSVFFLVTYPIKNTTDKLYLLYNERPPKKGFAHTQKKGPLLNVPLSIALITLLAILLVFWIARRLISKVLNPINELADMANGLDEYNPELSFEVMNDKTEIGVVANTLHQTMDRIYQFHQREKQFLQNASHELRTPIAVVSSALDIIDLRNSQGNSNIADQYINIRRANRNMTELIGALLLLSRNDSSKVHLETVDLNKLSEAIIDEHQYLLKGKDIVVDFVAKDNILHELPLALCRIALSNLIRNAFEHTLSGIVCVQLSNLTVSITNSSYLVDNYHSAGEQGISQGQGFGIGLEIVKKIASQQNWQLQFLSAHESTNQVIISFEQK